jgi:hypothetical protein
VVDWSKPYFQSIDLVGSIGFVVDNFELGIDLVGQSLSSPFVEVVVVVEGFQSIVLVQLGLIFEVSLMILFRLTWFK